MRASVFLGAVVVFVLLLSIFSSGFMLTAPVSLGETLERKVVAEYKATREKFPGLEEVNLNISLGSGGIKLVFDEDRNLAYKVTFKYSPNVEFPETSETFSGKTLTFQASQTASMATITLGPAFTYNLNIQLGNGGFTAEIGKHSNISNLTVKINSGGCSLAFLTGAKAEKVNLSITSGGATIRFDTRALNSNLNLNVNVGSGGVLVPPIKIGRNVGLKFEVYVASGGIVIGHSSLKVLKLTQKECVAITEGYGNARNRAEVWIDVNSGGVALDTPLPLPGFTLPSILSRESLTV